MAGNQAAWGLDVGVSSLKAIKLRRDGDRVLVEAFDVLEHDKFLSEPDVDRDALIRSTLQKFMNKYSVRRDLVFIGVPGSSTFARFVKLPPVETRKIPEIVRFEAIQQIPFPLDQVNWDYHTFQHPDSPDVEVGIFAMKKELVAHVMSNFRAVDMMVHGVQMSPLAVYNAAAYDEMTKDKGTVIIDMGAEHTDIVIMDQGRVWLRSISTGGNHFTDALAKSFKQQFAKAEQLKKTAATSKYQKQIYQAMRPIFADLVAEIQRSLGAYNSSHRDSRLEHIICMGNPFKLPNLQKYLQQELKMEVTRLESFRKATVEKAAAFSENILSMATAFGLASQALGLGAIETNLLPTEIARSMMWKKKQPWFVAASVLVALGGVAMAGQWWKAKANFANSPANEELKRDTLERESKDKDLKAAWDQVTGDFGKAQEQVDAQFTLLSARKVWPNVVADILSSLPVPQAGQSPLITITDVASEYRTNLAAASTSPPTGAAGGSGGGGGAAAVPSAPEPTATPGTATTAPSTTAPSDHGFLVTITGYTRTGDFKDIADWRDRLVAKSQQDVVPLDKIARDYYFDDAKNAKSLAQYGGHKIRLAPVGGGGAFGGGGGLGTPRPGAGSQQPGDSPWGAKGSSTPYWDVFFSDLTGINKQAATAPNLPGAATSDTSNTIPQAIDLVATRWTNPPTYRTMDGCYTFTLKFRVYVKNVIR
jgi:type IV pilus assembly protein PilM